MTTRALSEELYKSARKVKITARDKKTVPILGTIHLYQQDGQIVMESTNLTDTFREYAPCIWEGDNLDICVPMKPFIDWLRVVSKYGSLLRMSLDPATQILIIDLEGERSRTEFKCIDAQEFPPIESLLSKTLKEG